MFYDPALVQLSRLQFAVTALFHFTFVPLTLGLTWLLVLFEGRYIATNQLIYKDMTKFWGKLLAINFAIGVATGVTLEFEFGQNWAYFSQMIGSSFGPILAIEGITAFMLEATMFGLFFFGWDRMSAKKHFICTVLLAIAASLSIFNIISANSWMQHPFHTYVDYENSRILVQSVKVLYGSGLAQVRIGHIVCAGAILSSIFVMGISAYYMLKGRDLIFAKKSFAAAVVFGLTAALFSFYFGDTNGELIAKYQPEKLAATEGQWETQKAPASWSAFALPDQKNQLNRYDIKIPYMLSLIVSKSLSGTVTGAKDLEHVAEARIRSGLLAVKLLPKLRDHTISPAEAKIFYAHSKDIGFAMLLRKYNEDILAANPQQITSAAWDSIPSFAMCFFAFRVMIGIWSILCLLMVFGLYRVIKGDLFKMRRYLRLCVFAIPLPFIACWSGWLMAESGRQPWIIYHIMPTFSGVSSLHPAQVQTTLIAYILFYLILGSTELMLMVKYACLGPSSLHTGRYFFEKQGVLHD